MKVLTIKKRTIIIVLVCILIIGSAVGVFYAVKTASLSKLKYTIVLDAGHGGRDGGSVGVNGTIEKEINLEYTLALKEKLTNSGFRVELTRKTDDGLYSLTAPNKKLSDMSARFSIIQRTNPSLVISIHMNSFSDSSAYGAETYYRANDKASKYCADLIQSSFFTYLNARNKTSKVGDYYILNCSYYTAVLIECGYISNPTEEAKLNTEEYKNQFVEAVYNGILLYFGNTVKI